jgi:hypothetical protein
MSLPLDKKYALDRMNSTAIKQKLGTELHNCKNSVKGIYNFAVSGGAVGDITLLDDDGLAVVLPINAIVTNVIAHVATACTSGGSATVALKANSSADLCAATAVASLTSNALIAGVPVGTAATSVRLTAERTLKVTVAVAALTAGKINYHIEYMISA